MRKLLFALAVATAALGAGCATEGTVTYTATYRPPSLAYVSPGVYVVENYDYPVFYSNNAYWRFHNGVWYRSPYYNRGFVYYQRPPRAVVSIRYPNAYIRYRGTTHYRAGRDVRPGGMRVYDHRGF